MADKELFSGELQTILDKLQQITDTELPSLEDYVKKELDNIMELEAIIPEAFQRMVDIVVRLKKDWWGDNIPIQLSGSVVEGAAMARCFR